MKRATFPAKWLAALSIFSPEDGHGRDKQVEISVTFGTGPGSFRSAQTALEVEQKSVKNQRLLEVCQLREKRQNETKNETLKVTLVFQSVFWADRDCHHHSR